MFSRLRHTLASLVFLPEEEALWTARFVAGLLPVAMALLVALLVFHLIAGRFSQRLEVVGPLLLAWSWAWLLLSRGRVRRAALVFIIGTWIIATYAAVTADGVRAPAYLMYLLLVVYAAFLVTPAAALWVFIVSLLAGLVMTLGAYYHFLPLSAVVHTPANLYASYSADMLMIVLIVLMITARIPRCLRPPAQQ